VWVGLISYPLYLWHWPLVSFAWLIEPQGPPRSVRISIVAVSVALAWLTHEFVEKPVLRKKLNRFVPLTLAGYFRRAAGLVWKQL
jgi:peptidoglycan/LPS O-acetylase OafA/YrhL